MQVETSGSQMDLKVVLLGDNRVGKTSLVNRYMDDSFSCTSPTSFGASFRFRCVRLSAAAAAGRGGRSDDGAEPLLVSLGVWDLPSQQSRVESVQRSYCRDASIALVLFDLTRRETVDSVRRWVAKVRADAPASCLVVLVGAKHDKQDRVVTKTEGKALARGLGCEYGEVSAKKDAAGVVRLFEALAARAALVRAKEEAEEADGASSLALGRRGGRHRGNSRSEAHRIVEQIRIGQLDASTQPLLPSDDEDGGGGACGCCVVM